MKKIFILILIILSSLNIVKAQSETKWVLYKDWSLTNTQCNGCASLWYTIYKSEHRNELNTYSYLIYFQSASTWTNGYAARTEYRHLTFYYNNSEIFSSKWGIIGYTEDTQQSFHLHIDDRDVRYKLTFYFEDLKLN